MKFIIVSTLLFISLFAQKKEILATYLGNYDGDTIDFLTDVCCDNGFVKIRLLGVDTYEIKSKDKRAAIAKKLVEDLLTSYKTKIIISYSKNKYSIPVLQRDKYGRILARVVFLKKNKWIDLTDLLKEKKLNTGRFEDEY